MVNKMFFPPEWYEQDGVMLTWPHRGTDWAGILPEVEKTYIEIAREIIKREKLIIVCPDRNLIKNKFIEQGKDQTLWVIETEFKFKTLVMKIMGNVLKKNYVKRTERDMQRFKEMVESL